MKIVTIDQMRQLERGTEALGLPSPALMENAGRAVADAVGRNYPVHGRHVLVLVGPGNNGGDGLVAARHLHDMGARITPYLVGRSLVDEVKLRLLRARGVGVCLAADDPDTRLLQRLIDGSDLILDSLLGTGRSRPIGGILRTVLDLVNARERTRSPLVAVDLPTGLDADCGAADPHCPRADRTITLGRPKRGLFLPPGAEYVGEFTVVDIGLAPGLDDAFDLALATADDVRSWLPVRLALGHKGTFGKVLVVAGSANYTGAPALAAMGAYRAGAGLVTLATPRRVQAVLQSAVLEPTWMPLPEEPDGSLGPAAVEAIGAAATGSDALLLGPGLGRSEATARLIEALLARRTELAHLRWLIDADALNLLAAIPEFWTHLPERCVLTPHPGEMTRLAGPPGGLDRITLAGAAASRWRQIVVLKGAHTVIASPGNPAWVLPFANPALATAGTGDVLAGLIAGLLAQGLRPDRAAVAGAYLHGLAGELLRQRAGPSGGLASELLALVPAAMQMVRLGEAHDAPA
ncbi:MAG: NAD(P)H-hydrate dehydratase [Chloroflexi bacterium]|nr:NAD(P)H-hydrate dehydratase [Chloroflexota bacterium]